MDIVTDIVMDIDQERQTLPGAAAFQAELGASRTLVPATGRDPQRPSSKRRESHRHIEILDPRQLLFRKPSFAEFSHHRLPHFLPRYWSWLRGRRARLFGRELGREPQAKCDSEGE
jgi:hypothetical protein